MSQKLSCSSNDIRYLQFVSSNRTVIVMVNCIRTVFLLNASVLLLLFLNQFSVKFPYTYYRNRVDIKVAFRSLPGNK